MASVFAARAAARRRFGGGLQKASIVVPALEIAVRRGSAADMIDTTASANRSALKLNLPRH
jgi:hypothetical protein